MICAVCRRSIASGAAIDYEGGRYHPRCAVQVVLAAPQYHERHRRMGRPLVSFPPSSR